MRTGPVPGSGFRVPGSTIKVQGSSKVGASLDSRVPNLNFELGTLNSELCSYRIRVYLRLSAVSFCFSWRSWRFNICFWFSRRPFDSLRTGLGGSIIVLGSLGVLGGSILVIAFPPCPSSPPPLHPSPPPLSRAERGGSRFPSPWGEGHGMRD